jgi:aminoglycoside phosphotransferase (APT) family kinase protein
MPPGDVIAAALAGGVLTAGDVVWGEVTVEQIGRSHPVYRLSLGGGARAILKVFGPSRGGTDGEPGRERAVASLGLARPEVAALLAPSLPWRGDPRVIVTEAVAGAAAWTLDTLGGGDVEAATAWADLVSLVVAPLAAMHRATRDLARPGAAPPAALEAPAPWGLRVFDGDAPADVWATPSLALLLASVAGDRAVVAALREARSRWRRMCLVHGDLKHDNVLVCGAGAARPVVVVDWEMARIGDPAWDLAALAVRLPMAASSDDPWSEPVCAGVARLLGAYAAASGLPAAALARRMVLFAGAWLLMSAGQHRSTLPLDTRETGPEDLARKARATLVAADRLTAALTGRLG